MAHRGLLIVAELAVPETALIRRLSQRRVCERCGTNAAPTDCVNESAGASTETESDDTPRCHCGGTLQSRLDDHEEVARERLRVYERATRPLVDFYRQRQMLRVIDGTLAPELVTTHIARAIITSSR
jgi:adenylate kinase